MKTELLRVNTDNINHPNHYQSASGIEVIDVIEAFTEDLVGKEAICVGNILKYICRYYRKNGVEDLYKARWYLNRLISYFKTEEIKNE